jgi:WhiB family redox-sensing transcriptional regulator
MHDERMRTRMSANTDWRVRGACRDHDPELFFPDGDEPLARVQAGTAKAVCRTCPVAGTCLAWALATGQSYGVWGGLTQDERRAVLAVRAVTARFRAIDRARATRTQPTPAPAPVSEGDLVLALAALTHAITGRQVTA